MPANLATKETEIRRIKVQSQPKQIAHEGKILSQKTHDKKRAGRVAQGVGPEFKPQYQNKKKERKKS
jgi:hypothetical protein